MRRRLDRELVERGLAADDEEARELVSGGKVLVSGAPALKPARLVSRGAPIRIVGAPPPFVSRAGAKLSGALDAFGIDPRGRKCLDAGSGTGGFTDCLLQRSAASVTAVDVGRGQLHWRLRQDDRVEVIEGINLRTADPASLGGPFELVTADLSFISLDAVMDVLAEVVAGAGDLLMLVKPQFEAAAADVGAGGVVRDPRVWLEALQKVSASVAARDFGTRAIRPAEPRGAKGNREFFVWARRDALPPDPRMLEAAVGEAP